MEDMCFALRLATATYSFVNNVSSAKREEKEAVKARAELAKNRLRPGLRSDRVCFDHSRAYDAIIQDFLRPEAYWGTPKKFTGIFPLSKDRVMSIMETLQNSGDPFYHPTPVRKQLIGPSLEARVLLPLKHLAFAAAPHLFGPYFQMSNTMAKTCCKKFNQAMILHYRPKFLHLPTPVDVASITKLHEDMHGVKGMLGSINCMHTNWKNCPVAWQQSFQGKEHEPTIVLEAVADYNMWFWHASYEYCGMMNDIQIIKLSPLFWRLIDGLFLKVEKESGVVLFDVRSFGSFDHTYMLAVGIYPEWTWFVKSISEPITVPESRFAFWQSGVRKDVKRAFGNLQGRWKAVAYPIHTIAPERIGEMVTCCLILHNIGISDRVMGDVNKKYDPGSISKPREVAGQATTGGLPLQAAGKQAAEAAGGHCVPQGLPKEWTDKPKGLVTGITNMDLDIQQAFAREKELELMLAKEGHHRINRALLRYINSTYSDPHPVTFLDDTNVDSSDKSPDDLAATEVHGRYNLIVGKKDW